MIVNVSNVFMRANAFHFLLWAQSISLPKGQALGKKNGNMRLCNNNKKKDQKNKKIKQKRVQLFVS